MGRGTDELLYGRLSPLRHTALKELNRQRQLARDQWFDFAGRSGGQRLKLINQGLEILDTTVLLYYGPGQLWAATVTSKPGLGTSDNPVYGYKIYPYDARPMGGSRDFESLRRHMQSFSPVIPGDQVEGERGLGAVESIKPVKKDDDFSFRYQIAWADGTTSKIKESEFIPVGIELGDGPSLSRS